MAINVIPMVSGGAQASPQGRSSAGRVPPAIEPRPSPWTGFNKGLGSMMPYIMKAMEARRERGRNSELAQSLLDSGMGGSVRGVMPARPASPPEEALIETDGVTAKVELPEMDVFAKRPIDPEQAQIKKLLEDATKSGNINAINVAQKLSSAYQSRKAEDKRYRRGLEAQGRKRTLKTIIENTTTGGQKKVTYKVDPYGKLEKVKEADIVKITSGVSDEGVLSVGEVNLTTGEFTPLAAKTADLSPADMGRAINNLNLLNDWEELIKENKWAANELTGKPISFANWLSESIGQGTLHQGRAKIETMIAQMKPMLTPELLKDSRISESEWALVNAALGNTPFATGEQRLKAIPALRKILQIKIGMPVDGGGEGGRATKKSGKTYNPGDKDNFPWK